MMKKVLIFIWLCALGLCTWQAQAANTKPQPINNWEIADPPQGYEVINLQGSLMYGIGPNAIVAGVSDVDVYIGFNQSFGIVNISIYNGTGGLVYSTVVDTNVQQVVIIPFSGFANGTYIVEVSNAFGFADGDFEKD